ncbi:hypothetical protein HGM15179_021985, partial [Zosterops borbonicus]
PVANATITPGPLSHQVHTGDNVTLRCSVQVGSAPVNFTWLHNNREVSWDRVLELRDVDVGHSGTYQCMATNQLGQDGHRVFQALSPELALEVTPGSPWVTAAPQRPLPLRGLGELWAITVVGDVSTSDSDSDSTW